jgi:DNA gyrase inhibitor GyrI
MDELEVRIVELAPMRVASAWGFGREPEKMAWDRLLGWARPRGLLDDPESHRLFGFDNPDPSPGSPNYGYEVWIEVGPEAEPDSAADIRIQSFNGGLYAVTRCEVPKGEFGVIGQTWRRLAAWREGSRYRWGTHQLLEQSLPEARDDLEFVLDLHLPIAE